ncbi:MAG TPA: tyrosine-type recombinase/integrase [Gallionella sp.]|nr:tyrosine-type recombinase/integrase [Gallionella sp.]
MKLIIPDVDALPKKQNIKLTKLKVEGLPIPAEGQSLHWDNELRGFGVRVTPTGKRTYIVQGRSNGKSFRETLGTHGVLTVDEARRKARAKLVGYDEGVNPQIEKKQARAAAVTLLEVAEDYTENRRTAKGGKLTPKTVSDILRHVQYNFADWADSPIVGITGEMCRDRFEKISRRSPAQANQAFRVLRALLNFANDEENPRFNPATILSKKKLWNANKTKSNYIPLDKAGLVWNMLIERSVDETLLPVGRTGADIVIFLLLTGARWSEAAELRWDDVNLQNGSWHIADPKNHLPITLPLSAPVCAMLAARERIEGNDHVFPARGKVGHISRTHDTMMEVSRLAGLHISPHDLRRSFIAIGIRNKIELWKLKLLTNHVSKGDVTIDHYTETSDLRYLLADAEKIATWVAEQGAIAAAGNVVQLRGAA